MQNKQKGFTLIELLVVIAIIGILATIVLTSLGSARSKANDAKYQGQLSSLRASAENYYSSNGNSYTGLCLVTSTDTSGTYNLLLAANYGGTAPACNTSATAWAAYHQNASDSNYFCVDSTGVAKKETSAPGAVMACP